MAKMTQVPINSFVKIDCNYKNIPHYIKDTERTKIWGCNAIDITGDGKEEIFVIERAPDYWDSLSSYITVYPSEIK